MIGPIGPEFAPVYSCCKHVDSPVLLKYPVTTADAHARSPVSPVQGWFVQFLDWPADRLNQEQATWPKTVLSELFGRVLHRHFRHDH